MKVKTRVKIVLTNLSITYLYILLIMVNHEFRVLNAVMKTVYKYRNKSCDKISRQKLRQNIATKVAIKYSYKSRFISRCVYISSYKISRNVFDEFLRALPDKLASPALECRS